MKTILITIIILLFCSCKNDFYVQRKNQENDKREGEKIMGVYFDNVLLDKPEGNLQLFSKDIFKQTSRNQWEEQNKFIDKKLGKVLGKELLQWETSVIKGTNPKSEYLFVYDVKRKKYNSTETFYLIKDEETDSIKIYSYRIDSEGLLSSD